MCLSGHSQSLIEVEREVEDHQLSSKHLEITFDGKQMVYAPRVEVQRGAQSLNGLCGWVKQTFLFQAQTFFALCWTHPSKKSRWQDDLFKAAFATLFWSNCYHLFLLFSRKKKTENKCHRMYSNTDQADLIQSKIKWITKWFKILNVFTLVF